MHRADPDDLVEEQIVARYRARPPEYDDWWRRTGRCEPADGRELRIVKRSWSPDELEQELAALGCSAQVSEHQQLLMSGEVTPVERSARS